VGITNLNRGVISMLEGVLAPYVDFVKRMETTHQPVQHRIHSQLAKLYTHLDAWANAASDGDFARVNGKFYRKWRKTMTTDNAASAIDRGGEAATNPELVALVDKMGNKIAKRFREQLQSRTKPYAHHYAAFQLIDLRFPDADRAEEGLHDLCSRYDLDGDDILQDINSAREHFKGPAMAHHHAAMEKNLYAFYNSNKELFEQQWPALYEFQAIVFIQPFTTVVVESLFSRMNGTKSKLRNRLLPDRVDAVLHTHDVVSALDVEVTDAQPLPMFNGMVVLASAKCLEHTLAW